MGKLIYDEGKVSQKGRNCAPVPKILKILKSRKSWEIDLMFGQRNNALDLLPPSATGKKILFENAPLPIFIRRSYFHLAADSTVSHFSHIVDPAAMYSPSFFSIHFYQIKKNLFGSWLSFFCCRPPSTYSRIQSCFASLRIDISLSMYFSLTLCTPNICRKK